MKTCSWGRNGQNLDNQTFSNVNTSKPIVVGA